MAVELFAGNVFGNCWTANISRGFMFLAFSPCEAAGKPCTCSTIDPHQTSQLRIHCSASELKMLLRTPLPRNPRAWIPRIPLIMQICRESARSYPGWMKLRMEGNVKGNGEKNSNSSLRPRTPITTACQGGPHPSSRFANFAGTRRARRGWEGRAIPWGETNSAIGSGSKCGRRCENVVILPV